MILQLKSDLHLESGPYEPLCKQGDVVILAGDIDKGALGALWALENYPGKEIIYVPGNHEFHGLNASVVLDQLRGISASTRKLHVLQRDVIVIGHTRFIGCTLWTDYALLGDHHLNEAMAQASKGILGKRRIMTGYNGSAREIEVADIIDWHRLDVRFLVKTLKQPFAGKTVVVSHFAPSKRLLPLHKQKIAKGCRDASDLEWLIRKYQPDYWFCGHTHCNSDIYIGRTRVMSNQRGYPSHYLEDFNENLIVDLTRSTSFMPEKSSKIFFTKHTCKLN